MVKSIVEQSGVQFVLLSVPSEVGPITGFALMYETQGAAEKFFEHVHRYLTLGGGVSRSLIVSFTHGSPSESDSKLELFIVIADEVERYIAIEQIPVSDVDQLVRSLREYKYYFVLAGYRGTDGTFVPLPPDKYHYFKAELVVDRVPLFAAKSAKWPKANPFLQE